MTVEQSNSKSQGASQNESLSKRKRRKKKKSQKNRKKNQNNSLKSKSQSKSQQQTVHLPHAKITIRNIENTEKLGSLESVVELLRDLIRDRNEAKQKLDGPMMSEESALIAKIVSPVDIVLDESSISRILDREKERAYKELKERLKKKEEEQTASQQTGEEPSEAEIGTGTETEYEAQSQAQAENDAKDNAEFDDCLRTDVVNDEGPKLKSTVDIGSVQHDNKSEETKDKNSADANNISARVLYMVPPRKSRRRGELPGHCYLALFPPMPLFIQEKMKVIAAEEEVIKAAEKFELEKAAAAAEMATGDEIVDKAHVDCSEEETKNEELEATGVAMENSCKVKIEQKLATSITPTDRSRALAQCRLLLSETVSSLAHLCKEDDSKKDQTCNYKGVQIQLSPSQKIWKVEEKGSRKFGIAAKYDSTIENNDDFKKFKESRRKAAEDLMNRPRPPPGGGQVTDITNTDEKTGEGGEPVSAIVMHLLEKKAAARKAKKKANAEKKKSSKPKASEKSKKTVADGEKKKKRKKKSKKKGDASKNAVKALPKALLKKKV